ncbi:MAG TPA: PTS fructose transporter subunit IIA [Ottowia sp.]|uniref:PTS sugar transporter subunit IIA n=1 Tax=Ottowia sp. TaxID=1898956 RepID=UPI002C1BC186|nr:PTS fructose transporter subunit IIA [Ottowia sp.]HMN22471.1 PTS fructose transporter subunit IIA [Ottowia sp.]
MNAVLLVAHAPLAQALRQAALHVLPDAGADVLAVDVQAEATPEQSLALARAALARLGQRPGVLILSDVVGATPCNVASRLVQPPHSELLAGVNLPMLLRALSYRGESLEMMAERAVAGGVQGIRSVAAATSRTATASSP